MTQDVEQWLTEARAGDVSIRGRLLELYRNYIRLLARIEIGRRLQGKLDASDIVQDVFLDAHQHFPHFRGGTHPQLLSWLREILCSHVANHVRRFISRTQP